jgi:hypothetical protein
VIYAALVLVSIAVFLAGVIVGVWADERVRDDVERFERFDRGR